LPELAVTAVGADRPGIIARLTGVLLEHGGNLEDTAMTILSGQFAMVMVVSTDTAPAALEDALAEAVADMGMIVSVAEVGPGARGAPATHVVSVYGSDRPGMVHAAASVLAERDINVTDLATRVLDGESPVYAMMFEVCLDDDVDADELAETLRGMGGVDASIHPLDVATM